MAAKVAEQAAKVKVNHRMQQNALKCEELAKEPLEKLALNAKRNIDHMSPE